MSIKRTEAADIKYGTKDRLSDSDLEPRNIGHRISIIIPEDVLMRYRELAKREGVGYQTMMNKVLRQFAFSKGAEGLEGRVRRLEEAVLEKHRSNG